MKFWALREYWKRWMKCLLTANNKSSRETHLRWCLTLKEWQGRFGTFDETRIHWKVPEINCPITWKGVGYCFLEFTRCYLHYLFGDGKCLDHRGCFIVHAEKCSFLLWYGTELHVLHHHGQSEWIRPRTAASYTMFASCHFFLISNFRNLLAVQKVIRNKFGYCRHGDPICRPPSNVFFRQVKEVRSLGAGESI